MSAMTTLVFLTTPETKKSECSLLLGHWTPLTTQENFGPLFFKYVSDTTCFVGTQMPTNFVFKCPFCYTFSFPHASHNYRGCGGTNASVCIIDKCPTPKPCHHFLTSMVRGNGVVKGSGVFKGSGVWCSQGGRE